MAEEKFCLVFSAKCCLGNDIEIPVMVSGDMSMPANNDISSPCMLSSREASVLWRPFAKFYTHYNSFALNDLVHSLQLNRMCLHTLFVPCVGLGFFLHYTHSQLHSI